MNAEIVVAPASPEVAENSESLGFLSELITDSIGKLDSLKRSASTAIVDLLEQNLRLGWYLEDARHYLRKEGTYVEWIEKTCPLSYGHTTRLRQLAKHFCRDSIDNLQRRKLGIVIPGLLENGEHLRRQIAASECGSMADLFRYTGLLPDRASANGHKGNGNGKAPAADRFQEFSRSLEGLSQQTKQLSIDNLSSEQKQKLVCLLRPILTWYSDLRNVTERLS